MSQIIIPEDIDNKLGLIDPGGVGTKNPDIMRFSTVVVWKNNLKKF